MPRCLTCGQRWKGNHLRCPGGASPSSEPSLVAGDALPPLVFAGYELERTEARGGSGTLLAARRLRDGRQVAIKLLHQRGPEAEEALRREAEALRALGPPLVPEVHEVDRVSEGYPYLVMQFISHPTLAECMARQPGPLPEAAHQGLALAEALAAVHHGGFLHGDLKPENLFVPEEAHTLGLLDFGLARPWPPRSPPDASVDLPCAGTPEYKRLAADPSLAHVRAMRTKRG